MYPAASGETDASSQFAGKLSFSFGGKLIGRGADILRQMLLARLLSTSAFGVYALAITVFRLALLITPAGLNKSVVYWGSHLHDQPGRFDTLLRQAIGLGTIVAFVSAVVLALAAPLLALVFQEDSLVRALLLMSLALFAATVMIVLLSITLISQNIRYMVITDQLIQPLSHLGLILLVVMPLPTLEGAILAMGASYVIAAGAAAYLVYRLFPGTYRRQDQPSKSMIPQLLSFGVSGTLAGGMLPLLLLIDRLTVGLFRPVREAGIYLTASQIPFLFVMVLDSITHIVEPVIADAIARHDSAALERVYQRSARWLLYFCIPICLLTLVAAEDILVTLFGIEFAAATTATRLLVISLMTLASLAAPTSIVILLMADNKQRWTRTALAAFAVSLTCQLLLTPVYGINGTALANLVMALFLSATLTYQIYHYNGFSCFTRDYFRIWRFVLPAALIMALIAWWHPAPGLGYVIIQGLIVSVVFGGQVLFGMPEEDRASVTALLQRFGMRLSPNA